VVFKTEYSGYVNICPAFYFMFRVNFGNLSVNFDLRLIFEINKTDAYYFLNKCYIIGEEILFHIKHLKRKHANENKRKGGSVENSSWLV
jgi:hypothetical protein